MIFSLKILKNYIARCDFWSCRHFVDRLTSYISGASIAAKKISEECNVAMATVYKYSAYSSALDIIDEKVPDLVKRVRSGQLWISQANIIELSGLSKEQLLSLNNYLLAEKIEHLSYHDMKRELLLSLIHI